MNPDPLTTSPSELFEVLPGLPGVGPLPDQFTATGRGTHSEGFVVRFHPPSAESWVGNFQPGMCGCDGVFMHPDGRTVIVLSGGQAYHLDPQSRTCLRYFGGCISTVIREGLRGLVLLADSEQLWLLESAGLRWVSERVSLDGIRDLRIEPDAIVGEAYAPMSDRWYSIAVSLDTGRLRGRWSRFFRLW